MGDLTANFSRSEFACSCGCGSDNISLSLVDRLQMMRDIMGGIRITSGVRCEAHNAKIGGVPSSAHVPADLDDGEDEVGHAVDISVGSSGRRFKAIDALKAAGFKRIGIGRSFIHLDNDTRKPQDVVFDYYGADHQA